jgi:outer membrane protein
MHGVIIALLLALPGSVVASEKVEPLTLNAAVDYALKHNNQYLNLRDSMTLADISLAQARAEFQTQLRSSISSDARLGVETGSQYQVTLYQNLEDGDHWEVGVNSSEFGGSYLSELKLLYQRPLFSGEGRSRTIEVKEAAWNKDRSRRITRIGAEELLIKVVDAYYRAMLTAKEVEARQHEVEAATEFKRMVEARYKVGRASRLDTVRAEIALTRARNSQAQAESARRLAYDRLKILLGMHPSEEVTLEGEIPAPPEKLRAPLPDKSMAEIVDQRSEINEKQNEIELASQRISITRDAMKPAVDVSVQYSRVGQGPDWNSTFEFNDERVGINLTMNTDFRLTRQKGAHQKALIDYQRKQRELEQLKINFITELHNNHAALQRQWSQARLASENTSLAEQQLDLARIRFEKGLIDIQDVMGAEQELADSQVNEYRSRIEFLIARLQLQKAAGQLEELWDIPEFSTEG